MLYEVITDQFVVRLQDALSPSTFWAGLIKAPVFALLIAMVGTYRGMQVRDSSRELGRLTTVSSGLDTILGSFDLDQDGRPETLLSQRNNFV